MARGKRTRTSVSTGTAAVGAPIQQYFKVRRRGSYVSGVTRRKPVSKDAAVSCCSSDSDASEESKAPCFMCEEGAGRLVLCSTRGCCRRAHPACVGLDDRLRPLRDADHGADVDSASTASGDGPRFQPASDNDGVFLCDKCTPETEEGRKYSTLVRRRCCARARPALYALHRTML